MKQRRNSSREKAEVRDHGKDLFHVLMFLILLLGVLWYMNI